MESSIIEKYKIILSELLGQDIYFEYYISFSGFYPSEWRILKEEDISRVKNNDGLYIHVLFKRLEQETQVASFKLIQLPGCCGICISTQVHTEPLFRGKGINNILNRMRIQIARLSGYTILMCTDLIDNIPERKTLERNEWKDIYSFINNRTKNKIALSIKEL